MDLLVNADAFQPAAVLLWGLVADGSSDSSASLPWLSPGVWECLSIIKVGKDH